MQYNPPPKIRALLYLGSAVGSALVSYLSIKHYIGDAEVALWGALVGVVNSMAALNVTSNR